MRSPHHRAMPHCYPYDPMHKPRRTRDGSPNQALAATMLDQGNLDQTNHPHINEPTIENAVLRN